MVGLYRRLALGLLDGDNFFAELNPVTRVTGAITSQTDDNADVFAS